MDSLEPTGKPLLRSVSFLLRTDYMLLTWSKGGILMTCSNLGSAVRLEKRHNEIVAIPVHRRKALVARTHDHMPNET